MKKILLLLTMSFILTANSFAEFSIGPKIGYTATRLSINEDEISSSFRSSFQYGVFARIGDKFFLQPELMITQKGGFLNYENVNYDKTLQTVDIAALLGMNIFDGEFGNVNLQIGPVASIFTDKGVFEIDDVLKTSEVDDFMWALQFGVGLDIMLFTLDVRYEMGLNSIYSGEYDIKNSLIQVTLGFKLFSRK